MADIKVKPEYLGERVAFNGKQSALPLGERTDLHVLIDIAYASGNESLLRYFESYPTVEELRDAKEAEFLKKTEKLTAPK